MYDKRITLFMGHYGSGKTTVAVNYALSLARNKKKVSIYDLDIVNPYYRTIDAENMLKKGGVNIIVSQFAETNVDLPSINASAYKMVDDLSECAVVDVGGDDRGALALGRYSEKIKLENDYDALMVVNKYRPETRNIEGVISMMNEIETAGRIKFTGLVNNSNLGVDTTEEEIYEGLKFCREISMITGLPVKFTAIKNQLITKVKNVENVLPIEEIKYGDWL